MRRRSHRSDHSYRQAEPPPTAQDQRGTEQQRSGQIVPSEKTEADREDEQKHRDNETRLFQSADQLARFTRVLFLVAIASLYWSVRCYCSFS